MAKLTKAEKIIRKLQEDLEMFEFMGRHYRSMGIQDAYHFYRGKIEQCKTMIEYLKRNP